MMFYNLVARYTVQVSIIIIVSAGNFMYFAATSKYMIMGSRFVVGEFNN